MPDFTADKASVMFRTQIMEYPPRVNSRRGIESTTLTVTGSEDPGGPIAIAAAPGASWLTVPATCTDDTPFAVAVDVEALPRASRTRPTVLRETLTFSAGGFDDLEVVVELHIRRAGKPY